MTATIDEDRDEIRHLWLKSEESRNDPDAEVANALIRAAVAIADHWNAQGRIIELMSPLLDESEDRHVRYAAASVLLNHGQPDLAIPVLETVGVPEAKVILRRWRRQQQTQQS